VSEGALLAALTQLQPPPRDVVLVHSSLSALGEIEGGAEGVVRVLSQWCGGATLAMPTHTYCYPDENGAIQTFDPSLTPSVVGTITNVFWRSPGVVRSLHPTHSLACIGPAAGRLIEGHERCLTPCGKGTPYERLVQWDAGILMFGVTMDAYTLFHTAEDAAGVPYLYEKNTYSLSVKQPDFGERKIVMKRQDMKVRRRFHEIDRWLEARGLLSRTRVGLGELLWISHSADAHSAMVEALIADPLFLTERSATPLA
jgi:aminoglycoside 3-N-acetyltransferase